MSEDGWIIRNGRREPADFDAWLTGVREAFLVDTAMTGLDDEHRRVLGDGDAS